MVARMKPVSPKMSTLLQDLFAEKGFFSGRRSSTDQISTIERIVDSGEVAAIPFLTPLLAENVLIASAAGRGIAHLLEGACTGDIPDIDVQVRHWHGRDSYRRWRNLRLDATRRIDVDPPTRIAVVSILSCHPSGHLREEAVKELRGATTDSAVAFQLIRVNDWVEPVRSQARANLLELLEAQQYSPFFRHLSLVFRLKDCERDDHSAVVGAVLSALLREDAPEALTVALNNPERSTRRNTYLAAMLIRGVHRWRIIEAGLRHSDPVLRLWALRDARRESRPQWIHQQLLAGLVDSFVPVRREAILGIVEQFPAEAQAALIKMLNDGSGSIRELARFYLRRFGEQDFASFYRASLTKHPSREAIAGLGETGSAHDAQLVAPYVTSALASVRRAVVRSIGLLDAPGHKELLLSAIRDTSMKVSNEASAALSGITNDADVERLFALFQETAAAHVRLSVLRVLGTRPFWEVLPHLIMAASNPDAAVSGVAEWKILSRTNRIFTRPTSEQREAILAAIKDRQELLRPIVADQCRHWVRR